MSRPNRQNILCAGESSLETINRQLSTTRLIQTSRRDLQFSRFQKKTDVKLPIFFVIDLTSLTSAEVGGNILSCQFAHSLAIFCGLALL